MKENKKIRLVWKIYLLIVIPVLIGIPVLLGVIFISHEAIKPETKQDIWDDLPQINIQYERYNLKMGGDDWIESLAFDSDGTLWIGTDYGICVFNGTACTTTLLPGEYVNKIALDHLGNVWVGTHEGGVKVYDGKQWTTYNTSNSGLADNAVHAIAFDGQNDAWIGTFNGLNIFDGEQWTTFNMSNSDLPDNFIKTITFDHDDRAWIGTFGEGIAILENQFLTDNASEQSEIQVVSFYDKGIGGLSLSDDIEDILIDDDGKVYVATWGDLFTNNGSDWVIEGVQSSPASTMLTALELDSKGRLWIGGRGFSPGSMWIYSLGGAGLALLDEEELYIFHNSISSFSPPQVNDILIDEQGFVWLGTVNGLVKMPVETPLPISNSGVEELEQANRAENQQFEKKTDPRLLIYSLGPIWMFIVTVTIFISIGIHQRQKLENKTHRLLVIVLSSILGLGTTLIFCFLGLILGMGMHYATSIQFFFLLIAFPWLFGMGVGLITRWISFEILKARSKNASIMK